MKLHEPDGHNLFCVLEFVSEPDTVTPPLPVHERPDRYMFAFRTFLSVIQSGRPRVDGGGDFSKWTDVGQGGGVCLSQFLLGRL